MCSRPALPRTGLRSGAATVVWWTRRRDLRPACSRCCQACRRTAVVRRRGIRTLAVARRQTARRCSGVALLPESGWRCCRCRKSVQRAGSLGNTYKRPPPPPVLMLREFERPKPAIVDATSLSAVSCGITGEAGEQRTRTVGRQSWQGGAEE